MRVAAWSLLLVCLPFGPAAKAQAIPYRWHDVAIHGGGFVPALIDSRIQKGLMYARTDVGGAYRSTDSGARWTPITDHLGRSEANLTGIESLALDPTDAQKVYLAAGLYTAGWAANGAILRSSDQGRTWTQCALPFKLGGNEDGRNTGERLAVDPAHPATLFYGSRKAGLWRSNDSAATWTRVKSFPVANEVEGIGAGTGITFVLFGTTDRGKPAPIFVGVARVGASLYRSLDGGATWQAVAGLPPRTSSLFATRASVLGEDLIVVFNNAPGPNGIKDGAILRIKADGRAEEITPLRPGTDNGGHFGYGGLSVDASHPGTLMVTTIDRWNPADAIFRSTDEGRHWKELGASASFSEPGTPWMNGYTHGGGGTGWMSSIEIDPFNAAHALYTTGAGLWESKDISASDSGKPTHWEFSSNGLEETVPLVLVSPPAGAHLVSGLGDIGGFRHDDLDASPAGGFFTSPRFNNTESMDFATSRPLVMVRVGTGDRIVHIALSLDGGTSWKPLAKDPPGRADAGHVAIAADASAIVWTPRGGGAWRTEDLGYNWTQCAGLPSGLTVVSDRVRASRFYSFDPSSGLMYVSIDKARSFLAQKSSVAASGKRGTLSATPGLEGDLWLSLGDALLHSMDAGATFVRVDSVEAVDALGFGMAAPGSTYPTLFLAGASLKVDGVFRSIDRGHSWQRINDDLHQFGEYRVITGDPRLFGRVYLGTGGRGIEYGDPTALP